MGRTEPRPDGSPPRPSQPTDRRRRDRSPGGATAAAWRPTWVMSLAPMMMTARCVHAGARSTWPSRSCCGRPRWRRSSGARDDRARCSTPWRSSPPGFRPPPPRSPAANESPSIARRCEVPCLRTHRTDHPRGAACRTPISRRVLAWANATRRPPHRPSAPPPYRSGHCERLAWAARLTAPRPPAQEPAHGLPPGCRCADRG